MTGGTDASTLDNPSLQHPQSTTYTYDVLNDLTLAVQGQQQRSFVYDALGRLTGATTPEAGTVSYTYSDYGLVLTRTDARNVQASYQYDTLNRLLGVSYLLNGSSWSVMPNVCTPSGGTAANVCFMYGTSAASFNNGRPMQMTDPSGNETYAYDALGRITTLSKAVGTTAYPVNYSYDIVGNLKSITYPSGRIVQQTLDSLERLTQVSNSGTNYVSAIGYNSAWQPTGFNYGNGVSASFGYNSRMQLASLAYTSGGSTLLSLSYDYLTGAPGNNGQIQKVSDNVDSTRTTTFIYDGWLRLKTASNSQWSITETYDLYGNRNSQSPPVNFSQAADPATNRLPTPYAYDAAGNMTGDASNTLTYDGENRLISSTNGTTSGTYTYDGNSLRVSKSSGGTTTVYIFSGSKVIAEYDNGAAVASPSREYIYVGSQLAATLSGGTTTYHHADHLSVRVSTDSSGNVARTFGHYPFGETWYETGNASKWKFTSYERDSESGNDYALARSYVNRLARFSSPDPLGGWLSNPQSLNRYAYALNDPVNLKDPSGLFCEYFTDDGQGIESIDANSTSQECSDTGGTWVEGPNDSVTVTADVPPDFPLFSDLFLDQLSITSTKLANLPIWNALENLESLLTNDPDCLAFLNRKTEPGADAMASLRAIIDYGKFGQDLLPAKFDSKGNPTSVVNAWRGPSALAPQAVITVNSKGAFFNNTFMGVPNSTDNGKIAGGTSGAQTFILLHELGHVTEALASDLNKDAVGRQNNKDLEKNCSKTIKAAKKR